MIGVAAAVDPAEALRGIDLSIGKGEFVAVVGPSGSGKSTLMNLFGCLDTPTTGTFTLRGEKVAGLGKNDLAAVRNRRVRFAFQNFNLLPQITAYENVEMSLLFGQVSKAKREARVTEIMERVGLADRMHHKPTELHGGQMQRVAVSRVPADEPTGNLDTSSGGDIMGLFEELWSRGGPSS